VDGLYASLQVVYIDLVLNEGDLELRDSRSAIVVVGSDAVTASAVDVPWSGRAFQTWVLGIGAGNAELHLRACDPPDLGCVDEAKAGSRLDDKSVEMRAFGDQNSIDRPYRLAKAVLNGCAPFEGEEGSRHSDVFRSEPF
jgi:hypothetical protein